MKVSLEKSLSLTSAIGRTLLRVPSVPRNEEASYVTYLLLEIHCQPPHKTKKGPFLQILSCKWYPCLPSLALPSRSSDCVHCSLTLFFPSLSIFPTLSSCVGRTNKQSTFYFLTHRFRAATKGDARHDHAYKLSVIAHSGVPTLNSVVSQQCVCYLWFHEKINFQESLLTTTDKAAVYGRLLKVGKKLGGSIGFFFPLFFSV